MTSLFLERELNPSIARNPIPESKNALRKRLLETRLHAALGAAGTEALSRRLLDALKRYEPVC
ncbi:MAG: 5-formyltetrahydrofolate cyclo-ligase, partial [Paraburkholderia sp.]